ncbi:MAG: glycoside hydrolase family 20 zincin-like fold domain-containing protein [Anaerolineae bacterium]
MTHTTPTLLPRPRQMTLTGDQLSLPAAGVIVGAPALLFEAQTLQNVLKSVGRRWLITAAYGGDALEIKLIQTDTLPHREGYRLKITPDGISIIGSHAGVFYGVCTLRQLIEQYGTTLPCLFIDDSPDYPARGVMLDCSRDKVPTMDTLYDLVDLLASFKVNQVQLYVEHTFAYSEHREVWEHASPFTGEEILALDAFCRERHIDLVPNQNSLGHTERWLKFPRYIGLAESPEGFETDWGTREWRPASTLDPQDPGSLDLMRGLYSELLPHFSSKLVNVGCDEPWELGRGKSKAAVEARGGRVYLDYLLKLHRVVRDHGKQMQFWGDIIMHHPELIPELPKDCFAMEWGYEADHQFDEHGALFANSGIPYYVCPGTSSWNTLVGRTDNAIGNINNAAENGLKHGAVGFLNTDWGDLGHHQPLPVSYLGFAYGAAASWCLAANRDMDLPAALDAFVFRDKAKIMGKLVYDVGNVYQIIGYAWNSQILNVVLQRSEKQIKELKERVEAMTHISGNLTADGVRQTLHRVDELMHNIEQQDMQRPDAALVVDEYIQATNLLKHGGQWLLTVLGEAQKSPAELAQELDSLLKQQRAVWLARNPPRRFRRQHRPF